MKEYSEPRMHTAEHILNQTMVRLIKCGRSFSSHIERKKSKCDYHWDRNLTATEIAEIEKQVNEVIKANLPVWDEMVTREVAAQLYSLSRLPEDAGEALRVVHVGDYDACLCSGKHVTSSGEVGNFKVISTSQEDGVLRLRFKLPE